jgi:hypothetical protein
MGYVRIIKRTEADLLEDADLASKPRGWASRALAAAANQGPMPITARGRVTAANPPE